MRKYDIFTCESVTSGHPDKLCDAISDAVLDACLEQDPLSRVACETMASAGQVMISGQITTKAKIEIPDIARETILKIGYDSDKKFFNGNTCAINLSINKQSPDIALGVDVNGAGDQGMMFGYANNETDICLPFAFVKAHELCANLEKARTETNFIYPDGKSQVTVEYDKNNKIKRIDTVLLSTQHSEDIDINELRNYIAEEIIIPTFLDSSLLDDKTKILVNPTGRFNIGGPLGDTGLTGRKIIVDTYGGYAPHGGGAFSGKDPTKVDRSAAYMARYLAKNILTQYNLSECTVQLSYAIGVEQPISLTILTNEEELSENDKQYIKKYIKKNVDLSPKGIINKLNLRNPIYSNNVNYGHFGKNPEIYLWEKIDLFK